MWQQRTDHHGHAHPGSPGSKRTKLSINSSRGAACLKTLADASMACGPDDLQIQQTLYNTGMTALVQLTVKDQGQTCAPPLLAARHAELVPCTICMQCCCYESMLCKAERHCCVSGSRSSLCKMKSLSQQAQLRYRLASTPCILLSWRNYFRLTRLACV